MKTRLIRLSLVLAALCLATACAGIRPIEPGPYTVDNAYSVTVGKTWTAFPRNSRTRLHNLTIDGTALNSLTMAGDLPDGHILIYTRDPEKLVPAYSDDMSETELAAFVRDSLAAGGLADAEITGLRPEMFGTLTGVRFDIAGATPRGLKMAGTGKAAIEEGRLHLIVYTAPLEYYYGLHADEVEAILASVTLL